MRMVRVLGVLPGFVGFVCLILLTVSLVGIEIDSTRVQATTVPCLDDDAGGCPVGMTGSDFHVPWGFSLIDVEVNICLLYTSPSPRDRTRSRMPSSA